MRSLMACRLLHDQRGSNTTTTALLIMFGVLIGLSVLGILGPKLDAYFQHVAKCLNGC